MVLHQRKARRGRYLIETIMDADNADDLELLAHTLCKKNVCKKKKGIDLYMN